MYEKPKNQAVKGDLKLKQTLKIAKKHLLSVNCTDTITLGAEFCIGLL